MVNHRQQVAAGEKQNGAVDSRVVFGGGGGKNTA